MNAIKTVGDAVGEWVRLVNVSNAIGAHEKVEVHVTGKLVVDDDGQYSVIIGDCPAGHGTRSISFWPRHVDEVFRQPSGIAEITLKG